MLQFRAEFFNIFNVATFGNLGSTVGSPGFGYSYQTATAERQIQFGLSFFSEASTLCETLSVL
jgi:hypothetical protein